MIEKIKDKKSFLDVINPLDDAKEAFSTTFKLVASALTLVSALAWNEAIKGVFESLKENLYLKQVGIFAPFVYALFITIITVIIINRIEKFQEKLDKKERKIESDKIATKIVNKIKNK
jgi:hypothetical protein